MYPFIFLFAISTLFSMEIQLGNQTLTVEIADTNETRETGLMRRTNLPEGSGMLFIYQEPQILGFWMKNTIIPLSIGFFDKDKILINTAEMEPHTGTARSKRPGMYALEVPKGWFRRHQIEPGAKFSFLDQSDKIK